MDRAHLKILSQYHTYLLRYFDYFPIFRNKKIFHLIIILIYVILFLVQHQLIIIQHYWKPTISDSYDMGDAI